MEDHSSLRGRTIALVGIMGVGKSSIGKRLAQALDLPFRDADDEIETAAKRSVSEIFTELGEDEFRAGERRVISRLLDQPPHVLATGGGAFMNDMTRALIKAKAVSHQDVVSAVGQIDGDSLHRAASRRVRRAPIIASTAAWWGPSLVSMTTSASA